MALDPSSTIDISRAFGPMNTNGHDQQLSNSQLLFHTHYMRMRSLANNTAHGQYIQSRISRDSLTDLLSRFQSETRNHLTATLVHDIPSADDTREAAVQSLLIFILRTWWMCRIGNFPGELGHGQTCVPWLGDSSFLDAVSEFFHKQAINKPNKTLELGKSFKACNLERFGQIRIMWTSNLPDHLRLYDPSDDNEPYLLLVFHQVWFLERQRDLGLFPAGLVEETLLTLALLLPKYDLATTKWFRMQIKSMDYCLDSRAAELDPLEPSQRSTAGFHYWESRLVVLKNVYDASEPMTITHWWRDRRRRVQWATFWIAALVLMLTIFFGIVQSIEGALQVYKAYHP
ncbi:hypothetical protein BJX66DRAFT_225657 [Aspergillus keveii]|uniref:Uncharacterized protein n=1 Tax=Aspergillus keveii TaxID=714993 RepID=A0ABR4G337_9EURO